MKLYFAIDKPFEHENPYVAVLIRRLYEIDSKIEIGWGVSKFWTDEIFNFDIIHIQWPELLWKAGKKNLPETEKRFADIKAKGIKIVATCHNQIPHYCKDPAIIQNSEITYKSCDLILHLGNYSLNIFQGLYPKVQNKILYHHIYDDKENPYFDKKEACKHLKISSQYKYILCLGTFRDEEEKAMILSLSKSFENRKIKIIAPSFFRLKQPTGIRSFLKFLKKRIQIAITLLRFRNVITFGKYMPDSELPYLYNACDLVLIQRLKILNSGNLPLGFYMGKVVVGPKEGNVGEILNATQNPTFDPKDLSTLPNAIFKGLALEKNGKGQENKEYSIKHFASKHIANILYGYYKELLSTKSTDAVDPA
ncbi:MAG: hypothetical protein M0P13_00720 [Fibrobacteraceae bacterium]|nr:hypothetical protein [Fibrobacteraceae bacterium]